MIKEAISKLIEGFDLSHEEAKGAMEEIMTGQATQSQISAFLVLLRKKGEKLEELTAAVEVMRSHCSKIEIARDVILDTCGTGGDKKGTFNISTVTALIASGAGITVAKHGNRSVSSRCGSADILEELGININIDPDKMKTCLEEVGISFLFAPKLHPAMKYAMPVRKELGIRTMFNILGPLTNPAGATHQLLGVFSKDWVEVMAGVLKNLGTVHAMVVHGEDGLDEITTTTKTFICELKNKELKSFQISPEDFGFDLANEKDLVGGDAAFNAKILMQLLEGKESAYLNAALLNSGCAIYTADKAVDIKGGIELARESIKSGQAMKKLELLRQYTNN